MAILLIYIIVFIIAFYVVHLVTKMMTAQKDYTSLKTVTFGDESAVSPNRPASIISVLAIFMIWGAFTGSKLMPFHAPGPFIGETSLPIPQLMQRVRQMTQRLLSLFTIYSLAKRLQK